MEAMVPAPPITKPGIPTAYIWRRVHSLLGLWIVLFLIEHLTVNSQAALWVGHRGIEFVRLVNVIHGLPYLQVIETTLIGVPLIIHAAWGVKYLLTTRFIYARGGGSRPHLNMGRNRAYNWQRITSWLLLFAIILHVAKFRFVDYPERFYVGAQEYFYVDVSMDPGLSKLAKQLDVQLYDPSTIENEPALAGTKLAPGDVIAVAKDFGTASMLAVRDTFKYPVYLVLYTLFVFVACFHAFNGLWTFLITWGWVLRMAAQRFWVTMSIGLMLILLFLGWIAIWGTYWWNLKN